MGKKRKYLSHEEVWDDSALVDSWDAALREYQLYHSIHARGERVEDVLKAAEAAENTSVTKDQKTGQLPSDVVDGSLHSDDLEDGEVEDDQADDRSLPALGVEDEVVGVKEEVPTAQHHDMPAGVLGNDTQNSPAPHGMPSALMNGVQDESLKNLMISWYYAGYYTGLYEGQQQSNAATNHAVGNERADA